MTATDSTDLSPAFDYRREAEMAADVYTAFRNRLDSNLSNQITLTEVNDISRMFFDAYLDEVLGDYPEECTHDNESVILE